MSKMNNQNLIKYQSENEAKDINWKPTKIQLKFKRKSIQNLVKSNPKMTKNDQNRTAIEAINQWKWQLKICPKSNHNRTEIEPKIIPKSVKIDSKNLPETQLQLNQNRAKIGQNLTQKSVQKTN